MISVIVPAYNEEGFLPACLESLAKQDYRGKYEIIVADNASTDSTARIAAAYGVKVVSCPRRGVVYAREAGARAASGAIMIQADADTVYPQDWLTRIAKHFAANPKSVALAGVYAYQTHMRFGPMEHWFRHGMNQLGRVMLGRPVIISGANFAFRREAFLKTDAYDPTALYPDQWGVSHRLSHAGKISYDKALVVYTSARRVQNPPRVIMRQIGANIRGITVHFFKHEANIVKMRLATLQPLRTRRGRIASIFTLLAMCLIYGYVAPGSQIFGKVYYAGNTQDRVIALSFDDGPNEPYTSQIIDILNKYNIKATFFVIGKNVEMYPNTARRAVAEGDVLGNHTYYHNPNHALEVSERDIELGEEAVFKATGVRPHLYRPPHGKKSPWELEYIKKQNLIEVNWSDATNEIHRRFVFGKPTPTEIAARIIAKARPGTIILLHDGYGTEHDDAHADKSLTVEALPTVIEELTKQGYRFVTVPELFNIPAYNP